MTTAIQKVNTGKLQFGSIRIDEEYRKKWNINCNDFLLLCKGDEPLRNTLYRIGGMGKPNLNVDEYFMILKHVEAFYGDNITKIAKDKPHLESRWVILNKAGDEKVEFWWQPVLCLEKSQGN